MLNGITEHIVSFSVACVIIPIFIVSFVAVLMFDASGFLGHIDPNEV